MPGVTMRTTALSTIPSALGSVVVCSAMAIFEAGCDESADVGIERVVRDAGEGLISVHRRCRVQ